MKLKDFAFKFPGYNNRTSLCRVRLYKNKDSLLVIVSDIRSLMVGLSVTNGIERIRDKLINEGIIDLDTTVIEHYERSMYETPSFDIVTFNDDGHPDWKKTNIDKIVEICDTEKEELEQSLYDNEEILNQLKVARVEINPDIDKPLEVSENGRNKIIEISKKHVKKSTLQNLIDKRAKENEFQKVLKGDLSLFGEVYGNPTDEYICFSEFPIGNGKVDFVVFTSRSRMEIYLIEVKGADFSFANTSGYENLSAKINEAGQQIRKRFSYFRDHKNDFRKFVHNIRDEVESGSQKFNSLVGPECPLGVDPNKDIWIHGVVIGGYSIDDRKESKLRHEYESMSTPRIRLESWQSWLNKLKRV